jgi:hypothetical protein
MKYLAAGARGTLPLLVLAVALCGVAAAQANGSQSEDESRATAVAEEVMRTLNDGLAADSAAKFLSVFNDGMRDYSNFADQVAMFFSMYDNFRVHYRVIEARPISEAEKDLSVIVNVELQADDANNNVPGPNRNGQLHLRMSEGKNGWKITELEPREFFR